MGVLFNLRFRPVCSCVGLVVIVLQELIPSWRCFAAFLVIAAVFMIVPQKALHFRNAMI